MHELLKDIFLGLSSGIRHFAMLKLTGTGNKASGTVELFPLNGESQWCGAVRWICLFMQICSKWVQWEISWVVPSTKFHGNRCSSFMLTAMTTSTNSLVEVNVPLSSFLQVIVRVRLSRYPATWSTTWESSWRSARTTSACWSWGRTETSRRGSRPPCGPWTAFTTWWTPWSFASRRKSCRSDLGSTALRTEGEEAVRRDTITAMMKTGRRRCTHIAGRRNDGKKEKGGGSGLRI